MPDDNKVKQSITLKPGERGIVRLHRPPKVKLAAAVAPEEFRRAAVLPFGPATAEPRTRVEFFDLFTHFYQIDQGALIGSFPVWPTTTPNPASGQPQFQNGYIEYDDETVSLVDAEQQVILERILGNNQFGTSLAAPSNRPVRNVWPIHQNCGDLFLDFFLSRRDVRPDLRHKYVLQNGTKEWLKVRSPEEHLAWYQALDERVIDAADRAEYERGLRQVELEQQEVWLSRQLQLVRDKQGVLVPRLMPGSWEAELESLFYYEGFRTDDPEHYKYTEEPFFEAESVPMPKLTFGGLDREVRIYLVPQRWQFKYTYFAWYSFATWFWVLFIPIAQTGIYYNRFPLFPLPIKLGNQATDLPRAWAAIERSHSHARSVANDWAFGANGYVTIQFQFTSSGRFEIRRTDSYAKSLAAVVEYGGKRRYIWRRFATARDLTTEILSGPLETFHIKSWFVFTISLPGGNFPVFPA
jgi:hypothetical protein